ncbi:MAG: type IV pilin protein [Steroidobacteraceae bacterium]|jgi:type IV pilus assembly protein PilE|nr:type IV pilin protein [Steroidobacteraceae bacterium]
MSKTRQRGITLMELLIVIVIIGLLASIAWPSYRQQVVRSNRTDAKVALEQSRQGLERCFTRFNSYADGTGCELEFPFDVASGNYTISVERDATTFTLTATPQGGQAAQDAECANFTLDERGQRGISGTGDAQRCWSR